jgi:hypothetical protein
MDNRIYWLQMILTAMGAGQEWWSWSNKDLLNIWLPAGQVLRIPTCLRGIKLEWNHGSQWDGATPEDQCFRDHINKIKIRITKCDRLRWGKIPQAIKSSYELPTLNHVQTYSRRQHTECVNRSLVSANKKGDSFSVCRLFLQNSSSPPMQQQNDAHAGPLSSLRRSRFLLFHLFIPSTFLKKKRIKQTVVRCFVWGMPSSQFVYIFLKHTKVCITSVTAQPELAA